MIVRGSVDVVSGTEVRGWAFSPGRRDPVTVQAVLNHEILGEAAANLHRPDLAVAGLGDGNSGYAMKLFRPVDPLYLPFLVVKVDGGDAELPRAPLLGFAEFFASLYRSHPAAGRPRSVFGGLWTDRTDAAALLRGKTEIGQIPQGAEAGIAALIHTGVSLVELHRAPEPAEPLAEIVGAVLEDAALLPLLRAVLEDNPLAVQAERLDAAATALAQPSAGNPSPSPAECLAIVVSLGEGVVVDAVRDSHRLPEFTPLGVSRWASRAAADGLSVVGMQRAARPLFRADWCGGGDRPGDAVLRAGGGGADSLLAGAGASVGAGEGCGAAGDGAGEWGTVPLWMIALTSPGADTSHYDTAIYKLQFAYLRIVMLGCYEFPLSD